MSCPTSLRPFCNGGESACIDAAKTTTEPIGFNLLPQLFTLSQLQSLYEAIYGENIDKRNFRKRIAEMDYIEKTDKIDKTSSKRGAALYKFNEKAYRKAPKFKI